MDEHPGKVSGSKDSMYASCTANCVSRQPTMSSLRYDCSCLQTCWVSTERKKLGENSDLQHARST